MAKENKGIYTGIIEKDEKGNYFCGRYMLDYKKVTSGFNIGDKVTIMSAMDNRSDISNGQYPVKSRDFVLADKNQFIK